MIKSEKFEFKLSGQEAAYTSTHINVYAQAIKRLCQKQKMDF